MKTLITEILSQRKNYQELCLTRKSRLRVAGAAAISLPEKRRSLKRALQQASLTQPLIKMINREMIPIHMRNFPTCQTLKSFLNCRMASKTRQTSVDTKTGETMQMVTAWAASTSQRQSLSRGRSRKRHGCASTLINCIIRKDSARIAILQSTTEIAKPNSKWSRCRLNSKRPKTSENHNPSNHELETTTCLKPLFDKYQLTKPPIPELLSRRGSGGITKVWNPL